MTYNTDLQANNANLQSILNTINNLPEAGGSGASVETCTVTISTADSGFDIYFNTIDENGDATINTAEWVSDRMVSFATLTNVICGSIIILKAAIANMYIDGSAELYNLGVAPSIIKAPTVAGENCFINL